MALLYSLLCVFFQSRFAQSESSIPFNPDIKVLAHHPKVVTNLLSNAIKVSHEDPAVIQCQLSIGSFFPVHRYKSHQPSQDRGSSRCICPATKSRQLHPTSSPERAINQEQRAGVCICLSEYITILSYMMFVHLCARSETRVQVLSKEGRSCNSRSVISLIQFIDQQILHSFFRDSHRAV